MQTISELYESFMQIYSAVFAALSVEEQLGRANDLWNALEEEHMPDITAFTAAVNEKIRELIVTNAPRPSAFNPVERAMPLLPREAADIILEHDHYGSHADTSGQTMNE